MLVKNQTGFHDKNNLTNIPKMVRGRCVRVAVELCMISRAKMKDFRSEAAYLLPLNIHKNDFPLLSLSKAVLWEDVM